MSISELTKHTQLGLNDFKVSLKGLLNEIRSEASLSENFDQKEVKKSIANDDAVIYSSLLGGALAVAAVTIPGIDASTVHAALGGSLAISAATYFVVKSAIISKIDVSTTATEEHPLDKSPLQNLAKVPNVEKSATHDGTERYGPSEFQAAKGTTKERMRAINYSLKKGIAYGDGVKNNGENHRDIASKLSTKFVRRGPSHD